VARCPCGRRGIASDHLRNVWGQGLAGVLSLALAFLAFVLLDLRATFLALAALFGVWLIGELITNPNWPTTRLGRDVVIAVLALGFAASVVLGLTWNRLHDTRPMVVGTPTMHRATN
jgi:hypothetical protein